MSTMNNNNIESVKEMSPPQCNGYYHKPEQWMIKSSHMSKATINPISKIVDNMKLTPNPEKKMIALSIGDPCVFGNLLPPETAKEAMVEVLESNKYNGYPPAIGYESARAAVAKYSSCKGHTLTAKDIIMTSGCSHALEMCILALANPGDNILLPRPGFCYNTVATASRIDCKYYELNPQANWEIDLPSLESQIDERTVAIVMNNPSNPCGSVFSRQHLQQIVQLAEKYKLPIIADEIYAFLTFDGFEFIPIASVTETVPILSCGGLTKRYLIPGWRMGWISIFDKQGHFNEVRNGLAALITRFLGPNTLVQGSIKKIVEETSTQFYDSTLKLIQRNAEIAYEGLSRAPGLKPIKPQGAMYIMVAIDIASFPEYENDSSFTEQLVTEQSVFCLPGMCFEYPNYFRIVLTVPHDMMAEACSRMIQFCKAHYVEPVTNGTCS